MQNVDLKVFWSYSFDSYKMDMDSSASTWMPSPSHAWIMCDHDLWAQIL